MNILTYFSAPGIRRTMEKWLMYKYPVLTAAIIICMMTMACETSRPALESYRLRPTDERTMALTRSYIVDYARKQIGCKYQPGGKNNTGFDCSGMVIFVFREFEIPMAACSQQQARLGKSITLKEANTGDLIFFGNSKQINHVGIISKNSKNDLVVIHSTSSKGVIEENILKSDYWVKRIRKIVSLDSYTRNFDISANKVKEAQSSL